MSGKELTLWEVLDKYADIRDELEDVLYQCAELQDFIKMASEEIGDTLDHVQEELGRCDRVFRRYKVVPDRYVEPEEVDEGMPF